MSSDTRFVQLSKDATRAAQAVEKSLPTGVWTPWAEIKCVECVDTTHPLWKGDVDAIRKVRLKEHGEEVATCDRCGAEIWLPEEIAHEQRLVKALVEKGIPAHMQQTGGMCSAVEIWNKSETEYVMATEIGEGDEVGPVYCVGLYKGNMEDGFDDGEYWDALTFEMAQKKVAELYRRWQN